MTTQRNTSTGRNLVWFITGTSQGFGLELVRAALERGDSVVATSRHPEKVADSFKNYSDRLLAIPLDLTAQSSVDGGVASALKKFGAIDVLVNNAGHGLLGALEEVTEEEIKKVYEINVFGLLRLTRAVLPQMRKQKRGHVVNLSSIGGLVGLPGWSIYNSTKFAVEGLSEALAVEVAPLGIHVTIIEPGPFRTDFLGTSLTTTGKQMPEYAATAGQTRVNAPLRNGKQPGDPKLAADAIVKAVLAEKPPLHLPLGAFALERATTKLDAMKQEFNDWREVALSTDYK